ncbi:MAG TPA: metallophosphoesterase [Polyangia bacterium]|nr:metallophosphoesterase [Polyangia bacterium]
MSSFVVLAVALSGCTANERSLSDGGGVAPGGKSDNPGVTCRQCVSSRDCGANAACVQYGGDDYCGADCVSNAGCASGESCVASVTAEGAEVQVCVPASGTCGGGSGCANCPSGTQCDLVTGMCVQAPGNPGPGNPPPSGCPGYADPSTSSCCNSCQSGSSSCQSNGCYGGWYCDTNACKCHAPPSNCTGPSGGTPDAGVTPPTTYTGSIGPNGGSVSNLYFAIVGDTRPANIDGTNSYPTTIITKIYADLAAMNPQPQFVVTTGDYMFASPSGSQAQPQIAKYLSAAKQFTTGPIFAAMGNHECTGATASNCANSPTSNMTAYMNALVTPLGKTLPYYTVPINDTNGQWTAKIVIVACNAWDSTQKSWLQSELAKSTTYTFVVRHEPTGTSGPPCVSEMDAMMQSATYNLFIVGHSHTFSHSQKEVVIGNGGAPITSSVDYGYATIERQASGFVVTQYDYLSAMPVSTFTVQ